MSVSRLLWTVPLIALIAANPAFAGSGDLPYYEQSAPHRSGATIGLTLSLVKARDSRRSSVILGAAPLRSGSSAVPFGGRTQRPVMSLEFGSSDKPIIYIGNRQLGAAENSKNFGAGKILLLIAAAAAGALLISKLSDSDDKDDERCLIEPELCR